MNQASNSMPNLNCNVRFLNAAQSNNLDVYINGKLLTNNLSFGSTTNYKSIPSGEYLLEVYKSPNKSELLFKEEAVFLPQTFVTLSAIILESSLSVFTLTDGFPIQNSDNGFLRFINFSPDIGLLSLSLSDERVIFDNVEYIESTKYAKLFPGLYDFLITETESPEAFKKFITNKTIKKGSFYTIYIIGQSFGIPRLGYIFLEDGI